MAVLTGGCAYKPEAGSTLRFTGDVFSRDDILIQAPRERDDTERVAPEVDGSSSPGLSREFKIGIVVGVCLLFAIAIVLFFIYYLGFRKRDRLPEPEVFPRNSLRHQHSIDPDPALFGGHASRMYPWTSDSDGESGRGSGENFDYVSAAAMMQKSEGQGAALPAHAAYKPYIRSKRLAGLDGDEATVTTGVST